MKKNDRLNNTGWRKRESGISLIELMIALVLGLIVVSAVFNVFIGSSRSSTFSDGLRSLQENGRHGISVLQRGFRKAGYHPNGPIEAFLVGQSSDSAIAVQSFAATDCNGESTAANDGIAVNTYTFDGANNQITCTGSSASPTAMPLVDAVDGFQILYGVDSNMDGSVDSYNTYDASVSSFDVKSLRMAILVNSVEPIRTRAISETHALLTQEIATNDRIARNVFTTTVLLRNSR